jgi:hypothetical protein
MKSFYEKYASNIYSQNGEDGIIAECLKRIDIKEKVAVEFGAPTREYCSNIMALDGWDKHWFDLVPADPYVHKKTITPENVNDLPECSILSIDIDGNDYNVWKAYNGKPNIVVIEINSSIHPEAISPVSDPERGTGYSPMLQLGIMKGYFLLVHTGNLIFVLNEHRALFPEIVGDGLMNWKEYFKTDWL